MCPIILFDFSGEQGGNWNTVLGELEETARELSILKKMPHVPVLAFLIYKGRIGGGKMCKNCPVKRKSEGSDNEIKINMW